MSTHVHVMYMSNHHVHALNQFIINTFDAVSPYHVHVYAKFLKKIAHAIIGAIKVSSKRKESIMFCNVEITSAFFHERFCGEGYTTPVFVL